MKLSAKTFVRNCESDSDLEAVVQNIKSIGSGYYREGQDDVNSLRRFLSRTPDCVIVADDPQNKIIAGNLYVPDSQIPILARLAINPVFNDSTKERWEISRLLLNHAFDIVRERNETMPHVEIIHDWPPSLARSRPLPPFRVEYARFGFEYTHDLYSTEYALWDTEGNPTYIAPFADKAWSAA